MDKSLENHQGGGGVICFSKINIANVLFIEAIFDRETGAKRANLANFNMYPNICNVFLFFKNRGGSTYVWKFSKKSSVLGNAGFP